MILGKKIRLRLPESEADHELLVKWRNDPEMKLMFYDDEPISMESHLRWWERVKSDPTQRNYMIDVKASDIPKAIQNTIPQTYSAYLPIGMTALVGIDWVNRHAEYGRLKIDADYQRQGFAFDAEVTLMRHAFDSLNLHRVWLHALAYNEAVIKLHEKTGFQHEGCLKQHIFKHGDYLDVVAMGMSVERFHAINGKGD